MKKTEIACENGKVTITKAISVGMLEDINAAIVSIWETKKDRTMVDLSLADLLYIRQLIIADAVGNELSGLNLQESIDYHKSKKIKQIETQN